MSRSQKHYISLERVRNPALAQLLSKDGPYSIYPENLSPETAVESANDSTLAHDFVADMKRWNPMIYYPYREAGKNSWKLYNPNNLTAEDPEAEFQKLKSILKNLKEDRYSILFRAYAELSQLSSYLFRYPSYAASLILGLELIQIEAAETVASRCHRFLTVSPDHFLHYNNITTFHTAPMLTEAPREKKSDSTEFYGSIHFDATLEITDVHFKFCPKDFYYTGSSYFVNLMHWNLEAELVWFNKTLFEKAIELNAIGSQEGRKKFFLSLNKEQKAQLMQSSDSLLRLLKKHDSSLYQLIISKHVEKLLNGEPLSELLSYEFDSIIHLLSCEKNEAMSKVIQNFYTDFYVHLTRSQKKEFHEKCLIAFPEQARWASTLGPELPRHLAWHKTYYHSLKKAKSLAAAFMTACTALAIMAIVDFFIPFLPVITLTLSGPWVLPALLLGLGAGLILVSALSLFARAASKASSVIAELPAERANSQLSITSAHGGSAVIAQSPSHTALFAPPPQEKETEEDPCLVGPIHVLPVQNTLTPV